jgi:hypothetical protein
MVLQFRVRSMNILRCLRTDVLDHGAIFEERENVALEFEEESIVLLLGLHDIVKNSFSARQKNAYRPYFISPSPDR